MSKKLAEDFAAKYRPIAEQVGNQIGVDPNIILSQWALESAYGRKIPASNNIAGIQDFSGKGKAAKDPQTGKIGKYVEFEDPETFGMYYADMIKRQFPHVVNTGEDLGAFTRGLTAGRSGSYFESNPQKYATGLASFYNSMPGVESQDAPDITKFVQQAAQRSEDGLTLVPSPPRNTAPPPRTDKSGAAPSERLLYGGAGTALGLTTAGANAFLENRDASAARKAGAEESARLRVRRDEANAQAAILRQQQAAERLAAMQASAATPPPAAPGGVSASPQAVRIQQGTTGDLGTTGRARMTGFNTETSQLSAAEKQARANAQALKNMGIVTQDAPEFFSRQPGMTSSPSGVLYPRSEVPPPTPVGPRGPEGQVGGGRPPPPLSIPSTLAGASPDDLMLRPPPAEPGLMQRAKSGLDAAGDLFKSMMKPLAPLAGAAGQAMKVLSPPLAGLSAGLDTAEILHEMRKPKEQQDPVKIGLKGTGLATGALSMVPGRHQMFTLPAAVGAGATYEYMYNPRFRNYIREKLGLEPEQIEAAP
jgi:hypothetical protein